MEPQESFSHTEFTEFFRMNKISFIAFAKILIHIVDSVSRRRHEYEKCILRPKVSLISTLQFCSRG